MVRAKTNRLIIRDWEKDDISSFTSMVAQPEVMQHVGNGLPLSSEEAGVYANKCVANNKKNGWTRFIVEHAETGKFMGFCGYMEYLDEMDFGWRYNPEFWGQGYGTEAAMAVLQLGIHEFKFPRIMCIAYEENKASIRIIEKLRFDFEKKIILNNRTTLQYFKEEN